MWTGGGQRVSVVQGLSTRPAGLVPVRRTRPQFHRTLISTGPSSGRSAAGAALVLRGGGVGHQGTIGLVRGKLARSVKHRQAPVGVAMHPHPRLDEVVAVGLGGDLEALALEAHAVVASDGALVVLA